MKYWLLSPPQILFIFFFLYASASPQRHTIQWSPSVRNLTTVIAAGDTVAWNWTKSVEMSVQSASPRYSFQSSPVVSDQGFEYEVTFNRPGKFPYRCSVYPLAGGSVHVSSPTSQPTPSPTTAASGLTVRYPDFISVPLISSGVTVPKNWNMNLFVRESRVNIGSAFSFNTRVFCLRASPSSCTYPGPTIKVLPGDNVTIYFTNELGFDMPLSSSAFPNLPPHGVNTTNLYFHGLRLSPNSSSYFRQVAPGETAELTLSVQPNHAPGVHWYRSQNQGFSALHVLNGLVGAVVVEPETSVTRLNYPTSLKNADLVLMVVTKLVVAQETVRGVVSQSCGPQWSCDPLAQAPLCSGGEDRSPFNPLRLDSLQELTAQAGGRFDVNFQVNASSKGPAPSGSMDLVNGRYQPTVTITQSSPIVFRLIHASGGPPLRLSLTEGALCLMSVIAWDGVYARARTTLSLLTIPAGGRCEVEIKCGDLGVVEMFNQENNNQVLLRLRVQGLPQGGILRKNVKDEHLAEITRPSYLTDTADRAIDQSLSVSFSQTGRDPTSCAYGMAVGQRCGPGTDSTECRFRSYGGPTGSNKWDYVADQGFLTFEGALVEVTMPGSGSDWQSLHIQSSVFQIISAVNSSGDLSPFFQIGSWRDTLPPIADSVTVRFYVVHSPGETMLGSAFLPQQDKGALDTFLVLDFSEFQSLTPPPSSAPTQTPDDDLIGPLGTIWIIAIVAGVVVIGGAAAGYLTFCTKDRVYVVPKTDF